MLDNTIKVTSVHVIMGIITAFISAAFTMGWLGFRNDVVAGVIAFIILYFVGQLCQKLFQDDEKSITFSKWLWDGIAPFLLVWIIVFTLIYNYMPMV